MTSTITLTQGREALVDDDNYERLAQFKWHYKGGYAKRRVSYTDTYINMARSVINVPNGMLPEHIDHNGLNNQRANLRIATQSQNMQNQSKQRCRTTSVYKGVCWNSQRRKWVAYLHEGSRQIHLGMYTSEIAAACAYDIAAVLLFGEFASTNF